MDKHCNPWSHAATVSVSNSGKQQQQKKKISFRIATEFQKVSSTDIDLYCRPA